MTGNWGWAIILVTLGLKLIFFPLNQQAAISMNKMKKLQPEMNKIREKHKDDRMAQQQEIMKFMSAHKINPMKGCLPILPQIPVFFAFYRVLSTSIELRQAPFMGWIQDLSVADPYYVTPLLLGVAMFLQQKLTPNPSMDPAQAKMMLMMPVVFTVMMLGLPSGMVLYMLVNTIVSVAQQHWLNRKLA
ncbi:MAG: membrane protein insertase YidC [Bdellovibrionota bacterium]